jgi:dUTP pyrophosphatase
LKIQIKYHAPITEISLNEKGNWYDLRAAEEIELDSGQFGLISLGVSMKLPDGYEGHIVPRSSTFKTWGIIQTNHMGIIDNSYCGNDDIWKFPAYATRKTKISINDRICQFRIMKKQPKLEFEIVNDLKSENRGGFGSSGSK